MGAMALDHKVDKVHMYIEYCIQNYMKKTETMDILAAKGGIEPDFTRIVWEKLEEDNQEFFKAYYMRLLLKDQIIEFNRLLSIQIQLMNQHQNTGLSERSNTNELHVSTPSAESSREYRQPNSDERSIWSECSFHNREVGVSPNMMSEQIMRRGLNEQPNGRK